METPMSSPKLFSRPRIGDLKREIGMLFVVSAVLASHTFGLHWVFAVLAAPLIGTGIVLAIAVLVELLWLLVSGMDRVGAAIGVRKSPIQ
jgi:hypothetical protein